MADSAKGLHESALDYLPSGGGLPALRRAAADCRGCALYAHATQTVFGLGPADARTVLVGEQPGDQEDRQGKPFVGPAGGLLRKALAEAGIDENQVYFTNAVKHFKFAPLTDTRKKRIHKTPNLREITACRPWLAAELRRIDPELVVALGATAGKALFGSSFRVSEARGALLPLPDLSKWDIPPEQDAVQEAEENGHRFLATVHPSAVLRAKNRADAYQGLLSDLRMAARFLA
ncbi:UdgX family uracil-DNA binding protein (plasmid) [Streptomyces sp. NBC_00984]|uniref:UdgX family uracil-DNA binding protein n=1 Tax=Streptomyces sp. NBC_00984 TaxID=2903700 RepID=UPI002F91834C|nr:UdgX family uracil-DNA binding protein [Streptomyces sp. NBC_00984]